MDDPFAPSSEPADDRTTPVAYLLVALVATMGLAAVAWLARRGHALGSPRGRLAALLASGLLWSSGLVLLMKGILAPTVPGESGNPVFVVGFVFAVGAIGLLYSFASWFARHFIPDAERGLRARAAVGGGAVVALLLAQLAREVSPLQEFTQVILSLFQLLCLLAAVVAAIQWLENVHARTADLVPIATSTSAASADARASLAR